MLVWHVFPVKPTAHVQEKSFTKSYKREEAKGDISQKKGYKTSSRPPSCVFTHSAGSSVLARIGGAVVNVCLTISTGPSHGTRARVVRDHVLGINDFVIAHDFKNESAHTKASLFPL